MPASRALLLAVVIVAPRIAAADPPVRVTVEPMRIELTDPRQRVQLLVTVHDSAGGIRDLTHDAAVRVEPGTIARVERGRVIPLADGRAELIVKVAGRELRVPVVVKGLRKPGRVSFKYGLLAALTKQGCNSGGCHGAPSGKGGFRLSLRAFDPVLDVETLIREELGRRTNVVDPGESLLLSKPLMRVAHGGGQQLLPGDPAWRLIRDWIAQGCRPDPADQPRCVRTEVFPKERVLVFPAVSQQVRVLAHFSDGRVRDITHLAVYSSSDETIAEIDRGGRITASAGGQVGILVRYLDQMQAARLTFVRAVPGFTWTEPGSANPIDRLVNARLKQLWIQPSEAANDPQFLRRVMLDVTGLLPTVDQVRAFAADQRADRRERLIERLLESPAHAAFWATKWGDLFRVTRKQLGETGVHKFHRWLVAAVRDNMPYDRFVRELLTAQGGTFENPPTNFFRAAADTSDATETTARHFLGIRIQCAKCHNHPYERWTQDNYLGISAFFNRLRRSKPDGRGELIVWAARDGEVTHPKTGRPVAPWRPLAGSLDKPADPESDRRLALVDWLVRPDNPFLARVEVNRLWYHLCGQGIIEPIDDFRASNPPSNPELLDWLAAEFRRSGFNRRHIIRLILNSRTYQRDSKRNRFNEQDDRCFSRYRARQLSAEQVLDAICRVTGVPEDYPGLPAGTKATQLPAPEYGPLFLTIFGKPARDTGCECEREQGSNLSQHLHMVNGSVIGDKVSHNQNRFRRLIAEGRNDREIIEDLYLAAYCRLPNQAEMRISIEHIAKQDTREIAHEDIQWALMNSKEFLFQH